jgi:hypothetical protein
MDGIENKNQGGVRGFDHFCVFFQNYFLKFDLL